jgi:hypothetical protein
MTIEMPQPSLEEVQQREYTALVVPVRHDGPLTTHHLPARAATVFDFALTVSWQMCLAEDPKRQRATLISATDFRVSHTGGSDGRGGAYWPAKVPLVLENTASVWVSVATGTGLLTVITEEWAD